MALKSTLIFSYVWKYDGLYLSQGSYDMFYLDFFVFAAVMTGMSESPCRHQSNIKRTQVVVRSP